MRRDPAFLAERIAAIAALRVGTFPPPYASATVRASKMLIE
jgi:hypothetical protein